jgi:hypothetical protein
VVLEDKRFTEFAKERDRLNLRVDETRADVDEWFQRNRADAGLFELADLEERLQGRRKVLAELLELDDNFIAHLLELRRAGK